MKRELENLTKKYINLGLDKNLDYSKYYLYSIITHSTAIEGSTLTEMETQLLFDEGLTAKGKPLADHQMNEDLKRAYEFIMEAAKEKTLFSVEFMKKANSFVMKSTGTEYNTMAGTFDASKGDFRLLGVQAGVGGKSYMNYLKIPSKTLEMCNMVNALINEVKTPEDIYNLSFEIHYHIATIHPWRDGNGRTARLLMNYTQFFHKVLPTKIFKEDRADYISALRQSQDADDNQVFIDFMFSQQIKTLQSEIESHKKEQSRITTLKFRGNK